MQISCKIPLFDIFLISYLISTYTRNPIIANYRHIIPWHEKLRINWLKKKTNTNFLVFFYAILESLRKILLSYFPFYFLGQLLIWYLYLFAKVQESSRSIPSAATYRMKGAQMRFTISFQIREKKKSERAGRLWIVAASWETPATEELRKFSR